MIGQPLLFDPDLYLTAVEQMIASDEVERALHMLDNMPSFYREHPPKRALELKELLHRVLWTPVQYAGIYAGADVESEFWPLRAQCVEDIVREHSGAHIMELAGGSGWLHEGLRKREYKFTYNCLSLDEKLVTKEFFGGPAIFCAFELIEHLSNEWEIYQNYLKFNKQADYVLLSTPLHTYGGGNPNWRNGPLGHLRCYSVSEFHEIAAKMFTGFEWTAKTDDTIVLIGRKA